MDSKDWQSKLAAGAVLLAGIVATTAMGADTPAPKAAATCERHHDVDLAKLKERAARTFAAADTNGDGKITEAEFLAYQPKHDGKGKGHGMGRHKGMGMGIGMHRHGHGGKVSPERAAAAAAFEAELFKELDTDHNGQLSAAEFSKAREAMHSDAMRAFVKKQMFARLDENHDGVLTKDEFPRFAQKMGALDTNADGTVTPAEMKSARDAKKAAKGAAGKPTT
jgi:Ca2+-binding EF-hand superfamily protein